MRMTVTTTVAVACGRFRHNLTGRAVGRHRPCRREPTTSAAAPTLDVREATASRRRVRSRRGLRSMHLQVSCAVDELVCDPSPIIRGPSRSPFRRAAGAMRGVVEGHRAAESRGSGDRRRVRDLTAHRWPHRAVAGGDLSCGGCRPVPIHRESYLYRILRNRRRLSVHTV